MNNNKIWNINIVFYGILFYAVTIILAYAFLPKAIIGFEWILFQFLIIIFFFIGIYLFQNLQFKITERSFINRIFFFSIVIKSITVFINYYVFILYNGEPFNVISDPVEYHEEAQLLASFFKQGNFDFLTIIPREDISDMGGVIYYALTSMFTSSSIFNIIIGRLFNVLFASITLVLFYKTLKIFTAINIARISTIIFLFFPIFTLYSGTHLKETILIFIIINAIYLSHKIITLKKYNILNIFYLTFLIISIFFFRTTLAYVFLLSILAYIGVNMAKIFNLSFILLLVTFTIAFTLAYQSLIKDDTEMFLDKSDNYSEIVVTSNENRRGVKSGIGKYFTTPFMLVASIPAPIPTLIKNEHERSDAQFGNNALLSTSILKIFISFWTIIGLFFLIKKDFKKNSFSIIFFLSYTLLLAVSGLSFKIRYVLPIIPFYFYFAANGLVYLKKYKIGFVLFLTLLTVVITYYNISKLSASF